MHKWLLTVAFILFLSPIKAGTTSMATDSVVIWGKSVEYAGYTLVFEHTVNFTTRAKEELVRVPINADGTFRVAFVCHSTIRCFTDLERYRSFIYIEPGKKYQVKLPPFSERKDADRFNPYFVPEEVEMGVINNESAAFNQQIRDFDDTFISKYNQNAISLFSQSNKTLAGKIVHQLDSIFPADKDSYFQTYKNLRYARLYALAMKRQKRLLIDQYFSHINVDFDSPAYWEAFNEVFKDFFLFYFSSVQGKNLRTNFNMQRSFDTLSVTLKTDTLFTNDNLRETLLLKTLYDAYYSDRYDKGQIIKLVKQATERGSTPDTKLYATQLLEKLNKLRNGTPAPNIVGYNANGKEISTQDFKSKFVYINFVHTKNYACKKDLQAIASIARDFKKELDVVTVILDEDPEAAFSYLKPLNYKWTLIHFGGNGKTLLNYDIKAMPVYYLVDPDGNLVLSPAPGPEENFAANFVQVLRNYKINKARKEPEKLKTIYDF
jgi:hypothetical protein